MTYRSILQESLIVITHASDVGALGHVPLAETRGLAAARNCPSLVLTPFAQIKSLIIWGFSTRYNSIPASLDVERVVC